MAGVQRIVIVDPSEESRQILQSTLVGIEGAMLDAVCPRYDVFSDVVQQYRPQVAIIALDSDPETATQLIESLGSTCPDVAIVAVSGQTEGRFILDLIRKGVKEFVGLPIQLEEMVGALARVAKDASPDDQSAQESAKVWAFVGARGGVGCTSLAVNAGCVMAQQKNASVVLIDLNLAMGDADVCLDIVPDYTLTDIALHIDRIDLQMLKRSLSKHSSGLYLLPHPVKIEDGALIREDHISRVISLLKLNFTHILLDLSKGFQPFDFSLMGLADEIILTIQLDVSNLSYVLRLMQSMNERDGLADKIKVVANRVGADGSEISIERAVETIGKPIICQIPNDSRTMMASRNNGVPLLEYAPKSKLYQAIGQMCEALSTQEAGEGEEEKKKGFFFFG